MFLTNRHLAGFHPIFSLVAAVVLVGSVRTLRAGELTAAQPANPVAPTGSTSVTNSFNSTTNVNLGGTLTFTGRTIQKVRTVVPALLTGNAAPPQITANADDTVMRVKTQVSLTNNGKKAKNVAADVYISDDDFLDASDAKLATLKLADYFPGDTKIRRGETLNLPIRRKVPRAAAAYLEGKYLIAVLSAQTTTLTNANLATAILRPIPNLHQQTLTVPAGSPTTLSPSSGYSLGYLTASTAATLQVGPPLGQVSGTPLPPVVGILTHEGRSFYIEPGTSVTAQAGDQLSIYPGYTLAMTTAETWTTASGNFLVVAPGGEVANPVPEAASPISRPETPVNQIIVGPIHVP